MSHRFAVFARVTALDEEGLDDVVSDTSKPVAEQPSENRAATPKGETLLAHVTAIPRHTLLIVLLVVAVVALGCEDDATVPATDTAFLTKTATMCDPSTSNLLDFRQWREETDPSAVLTDSATGVKKSEGFWWGNYTFLGADGEPSTSGTWPYPYHPYWGFIRMKVVGNKLYQRNIFVYPPATSKMCQASTAAGTAAVASGLKGVCGTNGAEKTFEAEQSAVDCAGNLAGPYGSGMTLSDTFTTLTGNGTAILYQVKTPNYAAAGQVKFAAFSGKFIQSQLTTLPGNGLRVRTAQGFNPFGKGHVSNSVSYYREYRVADEREFLSKLAAVRAEASILPSDTCKHNSAGKVAKPNCFSHMLLSDDFQHVITCAEINAGDPDSRCA